MGLSGDIVVHVLAGALLAAPLPIAGFAGLLEVDPTTFVGAPVGVGTIGPGGVVAQTINVPGDPALVGQTFFSQSVRLVSKAFENNVRLSLTP